jgi:3-hydroxybutyryl-CoA dehydrogenase
LQLGTDFQLVKDVDLVISAVPENLELKKQIFSQLNSICKAETIFTTVTGVLSITELATVVDHPERVLGLHFKSPVLKTKLVEIVRGFATSDETFETGKTFIRSLGKNGIEVFEAPGLVTTRIIIPLLNEAMYALLEGVASAENIDTAMKLGYNMQMGPLELADRIGLDTLLNSMNYLFRERGDFKFRPCPLIKKLVRAKHFGVKTGQGFFKYDMKTGKKIPIPFPG